MREDFNTFAPQGVAGPHQLRNTKTWKFAASSSLFFALLSAGCARRPNDTPPPNRTVAAVEIPDLEPGSGRYLSMVEQVNNLAPGSRLPAVTPLFLDLGERCVIRKARSKDGKYIGTTIDISVTRQDPRFVNEHQDRAVLLFFGPTDRLISVTARGIPEIQPWRRGENDGSEQSVS